MNTPASLIEKLRLPGERQAWDRFVELYTPFLLGWARRACSGEDEAADLVQDVFTLLLTKLPEFVYRPDQSFRSWLRTVTMNRWREHCRRAAHEPRPDGGVDWTTLPGPDGAETLWDAEYRLQVARRALQLMQTDFESTTWKACWLVVAEGRSAADVAAELGTTVGAVYAARFRVLARLRQEFAGLLD